MNAGLLKTICYGLAVAMGVAVIVTGIVAPLPATTIGNLLGVGVAALGIAGLQK